MRGGAPSVSRQAVACVWCERNQSIFIQGALNIEFTIGFETGETADVRTILLRHFDLMREGPPAESCHMMNPKSLLETGVVLVGVRRFKTLHTLSEARDQGIGKVLLNTVLDHARDAGFTRISLEAGIADMFHSARRLY
jgi:putative acetyltransferase